MTDNPGPWSRDTRMRAAAFDHVRRLMELRGQLTSRDLQAGFMFEGERIPLVNPQRGIFKPRQMQFLLSIRTVHPRPGRKVWYDDQRAVDRVDFGADGTVDYAFMGTDPGAPDNRWLREAYEQGIPIIYFFGIAPQRYQALIPAFIAGWDPGALKAAVAFGQPEASTLTQSASIPDTSERRYTLTVVRQRLHQAQFRLAVIDAYDGHCALSGIGEHRLLDAAHIMPDADVTRGQPVVPNGLPLSKIHHAAFDAHLIGIDPDYRVHVSDRLLAQRDGPMLDALKQLHQKSLRRPRRTLDLPDRDRLAARFEQFRAAA